MNDYEIQGIKMYESGLKISEICEFFKCSRGKIERMLKRNNIKIRKRKDYCLFNKFFLDSVDSEEKAYFLGFMYADGYNQKESDNARLVVAGNDSDIIAKIAEITQHKNGYKITKQGNAQICFCSRHFSEKLDFWGCHQNKSLSLKFPEWMPEHLIPHFLRGYLDGDGYICSGKLARIVIVSTEDFCKSIQSISFEKLNIPRQQIPNHPNNDITKRYIITGRAKCIKFLDYIYKDSTIHLDRKYKKYIEMKEIY